MVSGDVAEAARCLRELNVPFYHHELVKRALLLAFGDSSHAAPLLKLLAALSDSGEVNQVDVCTHFPCSKGISSFAVDSFAHEALLSNCMD